MSHYKIQQYFFCILLTIISSYLSGCHTEENRVPVREEYIQNDIAYGSRERQKMDVILPAGRNEHTPFVILIHGGAWVAGNKEDMRPLQQMLKDSGMASVSINYRYVTEAIHYEHLMEDVQSAISYCYLHSDEWGIRSNKYIISGASAGAHMALLYGYDFDLDGRIGGIISLVGPADFTQTSWLDYSITAGLISAISNMVGAAYTPGTPLDPRFTKASPLHNLKNVPTLMMYGTADPLVPYSQAEDLRDALGGAGIPNKLETFTGAGHDLGMSDPENMKRVVEGFAKWCNTYGR